MQWTYNNQPVTQLPLNAVGFVYLISNTLTGKKYIGKKIAHFAKTTYKVVKLKNGTKKKKKIRSQVPSDWETYYGSNNDLNADILRLGDQNFTREILHYCKTKTEMSWLELKEQVDRNVLHRSDYYNAWISVKVSKRQLT
jgi:hypothetical protein